jgi:WD40 repeat protein
MSQEEPLKTRRLVPAGSGVPAPLSKDLVARGLADLQADSPVPVSPDEPAEPNSNGAWHCRAILRGHTGSVDYLAISGDGSLLATGGRDGTVRLWGLPEGEPIGTLDAHIGEVTCLAMATDKRFLVSGSDDGTVRLWGLPDGGLLKTMEAVRCRAVSSDGTLLVSGGADNTLRLWSLPEGVPIRTLEGHSDSANDLYLEMSPDGKFLASNFLASMGALGAGVMRLWELQEGRLLSAPLRTTPYDYVRALAWSSDGRLLAVGTDLDESISIWTLPEGKSRRLEGHTRAVNCLAISPNGRLLASGGLDDIVRLWSLPDGDSLQTLGGHGLRYVSQLVVSPDGRILVSGSGDGCVRLWRLPEGNPICTLEEHTELIQHLAMTPDSRILVSASYDGTARIWGS